MTLAMAGSSLDLRSGRRDAAEYRRVIQNARQAYQEARTAVVNLNPPASLKDLNDQYLGALDYYLAAADTMEAAADGDYQHLLDAIPSLRAGNERARDVALALWADEYLPN